MKILPFPVSKTTFVLLTSAAPRCVVLDAKTSIRSPAGVDLGSVTTGLLVFGVPPVQAEEEWVDIPFEVVYEGRSYPVVCGFPLHIELPNTRPFEQNDVISEAGLWNVETVPVTVEPKSVEEATLHRDKDGEIVGSTRAKFSRVQK